MATHGRKAQLFIGPPVSESPEPPSAEIDWKEIELIREGTFNRQRSEVDATTRGSGADDEFLPGHRNATYDATGAYDGANDGIKALIDNYDEDEALMWFRDRPQGSGTGKVEHVFKGFLLNASVSLPQRDIATIQASIRVSGKITRSVQS